MFVTIDRTESIDYLLRRDFGSLPSPIPKDANSLEWKLDEASRRRDLAMKGQEDPRPAIERRRAEYQLLSDEQLLATVQAAKQDDEKQAESLELHAEAVRGGAWLGWAKKDLWSEAEFAALCCGLIPDERGGPSDPWRTHADAVCILRANDDIRRGTLSKALEFVPRSDEDEASRMYGSARHYVPAIAVEWAVSRFDTLPPTLLEAVRARALNMQEPTTSAATRWPWGNHETKLLQDFAAAGIKFWALYDPTDPSTAPKNAAVVKWLEEQGVAERNAQVMATILRADGLPTGPR